jgi:hypothetical protein
MRAHLLFVLTSCSWLTVRGPAPPPAPRGDCTTTKTAPRLDRFAEVIGVIGSIAGGALLLGASNCSANLGDSCTVEGAYGFIAFVPSAVLAVTTGLSAHYGYDRVDRCLSRH